MRRAVMFAALALGGTDVAHAQQPSAYEQATVSVRRALAQETNFADARTLLTASSTQCGNDIRCRQLITFSLGFIHQREGEVTADSAMLREAAEQYQQVLSLEPRNADALYNLALTYRAMGPHEWQESFYREAPARDPQRRGLFNTFLGDYYRATGRMAEAVNAYRAAAAADPANEDARAGLLETFSARVTADGTLPADAALELFAYASELEPRFPELALRGFELIVAGARRSAPELAARACERYGSLLARSRRVEAEALAPLPQQWAPVVELNAYIARPDQPPQNWWRATPERTLALGRIALALGEQALTAGRPEVSESTWQAARGVVPEESAEALDLKRELALLYYRHPRLDPQGRKFAALVKEMFIEKGMVLSRDDTEGAQRYHTTLGLIYAERATWTSANRAYNALSQLQWALMAARRNDEKFDFHQPLPELHAQLARGLRTQNRVTEAREQERLAAVAFLDSDDLEAATKAAAAAVRAGATSPLQPLIRFRTRLESSPDSAQAALCARARIDAALAAVADDPRFARRQRFKILADCSRGAVPALRPQYAAEAIALAERREVVLIGMADVLRLDRAAAALPDGGRAGRTDAIVEHGDSARVALPVALPGEPRPGNVRIHPDVVAAARAVRAGGGLPR